MTDTRKEYEEWMNNCPLTLFGGEFQVSELAWQACQSLNDKRIQQLLAVIAKKDEAITNALREHGGFTIKGETERICRDALAIKPENVELVEVGYIDDFGNFENSLKPWMKDEPNIEWIPTYTIKTKASTK